MKPGLFRHVADTLTDGVAVQDERGRLTYVNRALLDLLGLEPEEVIGRASRTFFAADRRGEYDEQLSLRKQGSTAPYETLLEGKRGAKLVRISPQALFDEKGEFAGSSATVTAVGDIRRIEAERQIISEIARAVLVGHNLDEFLRFVHNCLKRVFFAENFFVALVDSTEETISFAYFVDQQDENPGPLPRSRTCTDYILRSGQPLLLTDELFEALAAKGEIELVGSPSPSWMGVPLKTPDKTIGVLAVQHYEDEGAFSQQDLELCTSVAGHIALAIEKTRSDEALYESRQLLTSVVESMRDGVIVLDRGFQLIYFSRAMERLTKTARQDILESGKPAWEHFPHLLETGGAELMRQAMQGQTQGGRELPFTLPDGTTGFTDEVYQPLLRTNREIRGVVGLVRDVTDRVEAQEDLRSKEAQLLHAQKMEAVGRLAGGIAHDFNNLLTAINGFAEIVLEGLPSESPLLPFVGEIHDAGTRAATLTQKLLALSRKQVVEARPVDLNLLIRKLAPVLEQLAGEHVEVVTKLAPEPLAVVLDPSQVEQVVLNLVVNGLDAMPGGGRLDIEMVTRELDESSATHEIVAGRYVGFEIRDSGVGMSEETQAQVFEPFFTTKDTSKGTGLGLAIVYGIVKQNDGYVWVQSKLGTGTCFEVLFPQGSHEVSPVAKRVANRPRPRGSETLLVVEDERAVRSLICGILKRNGYRLLEACDAAEALQIFGASEDSIDMMISDVVMPRMSGPELAQRLARADPALKVLFISGHPGETTENLGLIENAELLKKPFTAEALLRRVRSILDGDSPPVS